MITFSISVVILILGYIFYGALVAKIFGVDPSRKTAAVTHPDGVDCVPMPAWKMFMIQFLNIAGTGPIFGAIMGAQFGSAAYLWIVLGCIFGGAVHDYLAGMISLRHDGENLTSIVSRYLGSTIGVVASVVIVLLMILVGVVFVYTPAELLGMMTPEFSIGSLNITSDYSMLLWVGVIFIYYLVASMMPIDKVIGRIYPVFAVAMLIMAVGIFVCLLIKMPAIPEIFDGITNTHPQAETHPIFPMLFISIACGAVSGFHATQSPLMARCMTNEKQGRPIFFGAMITEGIVALIWCAAANAYYVEHGISTGDSAGSIVSFIANDWMGHVGAILALLGVVFAPITSGDTALRTVRLIIAERFKIDQTKIKNVLLIILPLFVVVAAILVFAMTNKAGFQVIWRYFAWANQSLSLFTFWALTAYLYRHNYKWHYITLVPAVFMTCVIVSYIFIAPEGFGMVQESNMVLLGSAIFAIVLSKLFYARERKLKSELKD